jgi:hypothetical protein
VFVLSNETYSYRYYNNVLSSSSKEILFGVVSDPCKPERRQAIRTSWASVGIHHHHRVRVVYVVAGTKCDVQAEFHQQQDLLWLQAREHYREGLTRKTMALVHYAHRDNVPYVFKTDDDVHVNVTQINLELSLRNHSSGTIIDYYGYGLLETKPIRDSADWGAKWYLSPETYPNEYFPDYAAGFGYALSQNFIKCAMERMPTMRHMPWEDVAVGMLAQTCNVTLVTTMNTYWYHFQVYDDWAYSPYEKYKDGGKQVSILHGVPPEYMKLLQHRLPLPPQNDTL